MRKAVQTVLMLVSGVGGMALASQQGGSDSDSKWEAPEEARARPNPIPSSPDVLSKGEALYKKHCQLCHGVTGKGDGPATKYVKPAPHDITTSEAQAEMTDGGIFWKMTVGKKPMPPFGKKLSDEERWILVHYVRSLKVASPK